jgi:hypothetical protein
MTTFFIAEFSGLGDGRIVPKWPSVTKFFFVLMFNVAAPLVIVIVHAGIFFLELLFGCMKIFSKEIYVWRDNKMGSSGLFRSHRFFNLRRSNQHKQAA